MAAITEEWLAEVGFKYREPEERQTFRHWTLTFSQHDDDGCGPYHEPEDHCEDCLELMAERYRQRREFEHYHPGERCPESELTPMPTLPKP